MPRGNYLKRYLKSSSLKRRGLRFSQVIVGLKIYTICGEEYNLPSGGMRGQSKERKPGAWTPGPLCLPDPISLPPGVAVALKQAMTPEFRLYQHQVVANCRVLAETLMELGYKVVTGTSRNPGEVPLAPWGGIEASPSDTVATVALGAVAAAMDSLSLARETTGKLCGRRT